MFANYHTHTTRCRHAAGTDREYVEAAIKSGLTILGFADHTPLPDRAMCGMAPEGADFCEGIIRLGLASKADLFICQMQDYLGLGAEARMNEPGTLKAQNWRWRMAADAADEALAGKIKALAEAYGRA